MNSNKRFGEHRRTHQRRAGRSSAGYSREVVLIICAVLLVLMFSVTALVARLYHKRIHTLADDWFARGESAFRSRNPVQALADYQNALVYSPNNPIFQLHLAQTLTAAHRDDEAISYLTNLLGESPGNGEINLDLARISARKSEFLAATRYYHSAIYGVWETDPLAKRWSVRRELCEYLLDRGDVTDAQPEIIALAQEVASGDLERQKEAGAFLLRAGLWDRALQEFQSTLTFDRNDQEALAGAGTAAYQLGQYSKALGYMEDLPRERTADPKIAGMLEFCRQFEAANPLGEGLSTAEKAKRTTAALTQAESRIANCAHEHGESLSQPAETVLQKLFATSHENTRQWSEANLKLYPYRVAAAMALVFQMENAASQECGQPPVGPDRVLWVIGQSVSAGDNGQ